MAGVHGIGAGCYAGDCRFYRCTMLTRQFGRIIVGPLINYQHFVTRVQRIQSASQAQRIIVGVQQSRDFRHS